MRSWVAIAGILRCRFDVNGPVTLDLAPEPCRASAVGVAKRAKSRETMMQDEHGLEVTTSVPEVIEAIELYRCELLRLGPRIPAILEAADAHPDCCLVNAYAATLGLFDQTREGARMAARYLERAEAAAATTGATPRERQFLDAAKTWAAGHFEVAAQRLEALLGEARRDLVAAKTLEFLYYLKGQHFSARRFLEAMDAIAADNADSGLFLSMHSFAQELSGHYDAARRSAERGLELEPENPWADHTLSHLLLKTGRIGEGIAVLEDHRGRWHGDVAKSHNNWHLALMHLEMRDGDTALSFLRGRILTTPTPWTVHKLDAASLLWRLELAGFEVPAADWELVAGVVAEDASVCATAFNSAHYLHALVRAGRENEAVEAKAAIEEAVTATDGDEERVWRTVGLPLIEAALAFARRDHAAAARFLGPIAGDLWQAGGSDAQVDMFRQTYLVSLIETGERSAARAFMDVALVVPGAPSTPLQDHWRARL